MSVLRSFENNIVISAYNIIADAALPPELEPVRRDRLAAYAPLVVSHLLTRGERKAAWRIYAAGTYPWPRRLSLRGLLQGGLLALPPAMARAVLVARRSLRPQ